MYPLDYRYEASHLHSENMKGRDRRVCVAMRDACFLAGFYLMLANLSPHESQAGEEVDTPLADVYGLHWM